MALSNWYSTGTVSVESGSTTVTVTDGFWGDDAIMAGDLFCDPAQPLVPPQRVKEVTGNAELELWAPWPGDDIEDGAYEIRYVGIIERSTAQTRKVLEQLGDVKAWYDVIVEDDAARLALETEGNPLRAGYRVLVRDDGVIWAKASSAYGAWIGPVEFKGDKGDKGWSPQLVAETDDDRRVLKLGGYVGGEGDAPTANVGQYLKADGTWTTTIGDAVDFRGEGFVFVGEYDEEASYGPGNIARNNGSAWITLQPTTGNAPPIYPTTSNAYWALLAVKGQDGTGTGDVIGPSGGVINGEIMVADGMSGKSIKGSGKTIADLGGAPSAPQGRLTLQSGVPVMVSNQTAKATIYYTPYIGDSVPLYDGTRMVSRTFTELSIATTDTTKNPAAIGASKINDWFIWDDAGTLRLSHGPDWTSDTARSAGTAIELLNGIFVNSASITNGPAAQRGTYVGTTRSNGSSQLDWSFGGVGAGGFLNVWNTYNRVDFVSTVRDAATSGWSYATAAWRAANASITSRCSFVRGLNDDPVSARYAALGFSTSNGVQIGLSIGLDSTSAPASMASTATTFFASTSNNQIASIAEFNGYPGAGYHFTQALESGGNNAFFGQDNGLTKGGLYTNIRA